jgi:HlyD family secretion protein
MAKLRSSDLLRQVGTLFGVGTATGLSDSQLLERFRSKSASAVEDTRAAEAAFEVLVARHGPMVLGVCRRALADPADVEDAFQATFLVLVRRAGSVRVGDSLGRWLYGVSRRVAAKARARSSRARIRTTPLEVEPAAPDTPADQSGLLAALDDEVSRLPEKYRAPVVFCHLEGLSHAEAADRLRWPVGTVSGRLS